VQIFRSFGRDRKLRKLLKNKRAEEAHTDKLVRRAKKNNASDDDINELYDELFQLTDYYEDQIATEESVYLITEAADYRVPVPAYDPNSPWWEQAKHSMRWRLNEAGRVNLLAAIRREQRDRWEARSRLLPFIGAITGLLGVVVGILALVLHRS
jgi:hypothetical protein